ncbi:hypothetical protein PoB_003467500 [Plakobranchus ocellatus]|uniref:Uncharacterized protein n=1 Tax=Plakobranchus ocellatus TaxID=259542 RepID=A0AAV4AJ29_9GAST|nr:hypothetical protein PoB_003467500 [Plakobranchus ocellatus]
MDIFLSHIVTLAVLPHELSPQLCQVKNWKFCPIPPATQPVHSCACTSRQQVQTIVYYRFYFKIDVVDESYICLKAMNLSRDHGHVHVSADRASLLTFYCTLVPSNSDSDSVVYESAKKHFLKALDPRHHLGLRIDLGAFRTSLYPKFLC